MQYFDKKFFSRRFNQKTTPEQKIMMIGPLLYEISSLQKKNPSHFPNFWGETFFLSFFSRREIKGKIGENIAFFIFQFLCS